MLVNITDDNFEKEVINNSIPVLVDFWSDWCGPCKKMAPVMTELAEEYKGIIKVCKGNMDVAGKTMAQYRISSLPAILLFKDGECVSKNIGLRTKSDIEKDIETVL
jgi:thioredoxin 1